MKKILLSSIIMLGVCGAVNAQTGKFKKNETSTSTSTSAAAPAATPQKAALLPATSDNVVAPATPVTAADKQALQTAPAPVNRGKAKEQAKQAQAPAVAPVSDEEKIKADQAAKAKAAGEDIKKA